MSDYRNTLRLAREVESVRRALDDAETVDQVEALEKRVRVLHVEVAAALAAHAATRPWFSRWVWALRLRRFERLARRAGRA